MICDDSDEVQEWRYSMRRQMQEVYPGIFLGPYSVAGKTQLAQLQAAGISHIVCVRCEAEEHIVRPHFPDVFKYLVVTMENSSNNSTPRSAPPLDEVLAESNAFIAACAEVGGRCLVHGLGGLSRSAVLVIAYIIADTHCSELDALRLVANRRYCVSVDRYYMKLLQQFAIAVTQQTSGPPVKRRKLERGESCE